MHSFVIYTCAGSLHFFNRDTNIRLLFFPPPLHKFTSYNPNPDVSVSKGLIHKMHNMEKKPLKNIEKKIKIDLFDFIRGMRANQKKKKREKAKTLTFSVGTRCVYSHKVLPNQLTCDLQIVKLALVRRNLRNSLFFLLLLSSVS